MKIFPHKLAQEDLIFDSVAETMDDIFISEALSGAARMTGNVIQVSRSRIEGLLGNVDAILGPYGPKHLEKPSYDVWFTAAVMKNNDASTKITMARAEKMIKKVTEALQSMPLAQGSRYEPPELVLELNVTVLFTVTFTSPAIFVEAV
jgi:hypothetical protein